MELSKKKAQSLADFKTTIAPAQADDQLELDEIFTFYTLKINGGGQPSNSHLDSLK